MGLMYKRNGKNEENYFGGGATLSLNKIVSIGYSVYQDVLYEDLRGETVDVYDKFGNTSSVHFPDAPSSLTNIPARVESVVLGLKWGNMAFDHLTLKTEFEDDVINPGVTKIFNASMFYKKWIFSYGKREEDSWREAYTGESFVATKRKYNSFLGAQYSLSKNFMAGIFHNYYLLNELTVGLTLFL